MDGNDFMLMIIICLQVHYLGLQQLNLTVIMFYKCLRIPLIPQLVSKFLILLPLLFEMFP
jgi:hypothetical protein